MWSFVCLSQNLPFTIAIVIVILVAFLEIIGLVLGSGFTPLLESLFSSVEISALDKFSAWLKISQLPILVWIILFLTTFGLIGLSLQMGLNAYTGTILPALPMSVLSFIITLPIVRVCAGALEKLLTHNESTAIALDDLIGSIAIVTLGTATHTQPTSAKVKDAFGHTHYILLAPLSPTQTLVEKDAVLITKRVNNMYLGIKK